MSDFRKLSIVRLAGIAAAGCLLAGPAAGAPQTAESSDASQAVHGKIVYRVYCTSCHGAEGRGDGNLAQYLKIPPADLTQLAARNGGEFPAERVERIIDGRREVPAHSADMPVWGDAFQKTGDLENQPSEVREAEVARKIATLVAYLRSIQGAE